ncbi:MAG: hypothetical protein H7Y06_13490 [Opitutaceae bacterium]|nr:hypothetical protein [Opitutaceae bacterium]
MLDFVTTTWRALNFTAGSVLSIVSSTTLPSGVVTGFDLYCPSGGSGGAHFDSFTINGAADTNGLADAIVIPSGEPRRFYRALVWLV